MSSGIKHHLKPTPVNNPVEVCYDQNSWICMALWIDLDINPHVHTEIYMYLLPVHSIWLISKFWDNFKETFKIFPS